MTPCVCGHQDWEHFARSGECISGGSACGCVEYVPDDGTEKGGATFPLGTNCRYDGIYYRAGEWRPQSGDR